MASKSHLTVNKRGSGVLRCLACHRPVVFYGDRCPPCQNELRQRKRRRPR